jgi:hypothetical protein
MIVPFYTLIHCDETEYCSVDGFVFLLIIEIVSDVAISRELARAKIVASGNVAN